MGLWGCRQAGEAACHGAVIGRKYPRMHAPYRFGPQEVDACGGPRRTLEKDPVESDLPAPGVPAKEQRIIAFVGAIQVRRQLALPVADGN